jgi:hypothetical protein
MSKSPVALAATYAANAAGSLQAHDGVVASKSFTGPLIAFQA